MPDIKYKYYRYTRWQHTRSTPSTQEVFGGGGSTPARPAHWIYSHIARKELAIASGKRPCVRACVFARALTYVRGSDVALKLDIFVASRGAEGGGSRLSVVLSWFRPDYIKLAGGKTQSPLSAQHTKTHPRKSVDKLSDHRHSPVLAMGAMDPSHRFILRPAGRHFTRMLVFYMRTCMRLCVVHIVRSPATAPVPAAINPPSFI